MEQQIHARDLIVLTVGAALVVACADEPTSVPVTARPYSSAHSNSGVGGPRQSDSIPDAYIVLLQPNVPDVAVTARRLIHQHGADEQNVWDGGVRGFSVRRMKAARAALLAQDPAVRLVEPDRVIFPLGQQTLPYQSPGYYASALWALDRIDRQGSATYDGFFNYINTGANTHIYIVDSGVRASHQELAGRVGVGVCYITLSIGCSPTIDQAGHGTAVASAAAGTNFGVAKQAWIHPVRVLTGPDSFQEVTLVPGPPVPTSCPV